VLGDPDWSGARTVFDVLRRIELAPLVGEGSGQLTIGEIRFVVNSLGAPCDCLLVEIACEVVDCLVLIDPVSNPEPCDVRRLGRGLDDFRWM
jgi:hypothetical protein